MKGPLETLFGAVIPTAVSVRLEYLMTSPPKLLHYAAFNAHSETLCLIPLDVMPANEDTARLDWIVSHQFMRVVQSKTGWVVWDVGGGLDIYAEGKTFREAVDAAMAKEKA